MTDTEPKVQITLADSVAHMVANDPELRSHTAEFHVNQIVRAHYQRKLMDSMPSTKDIILGNLKTIASGSTFTVIDVMDSLHKRDPKKRGDYGRMLSLMIARNQIPVKFTDVMKDTYKVYIKR